MSTLCAPNSSPAPRASPDVPRDGGSRRGGAQGHGGEARGAGEEFGAQRVDMLSQRHLEAAGLSEISRKVERGERLSREDGISLYEHPDLNAVGSLANQVRERLQGNVA